MFDSKILQELGSAKGLTGLILIQTYRESLTLGHLSLSSSRPFPQGFIRIL